MMMIDDDDVDDDDVNMKRVDTTPPRLLCENQTESVVSSTKTVDTTTSRLL